MCRNFLFVLYLRGDLVRQKHLLDQVVQVLQAHRGKPFYRIFRKFLLVVLGVLGIRLVLYHQFDLWVRVLHPYQVVQSYLFRGCQVYLSLLGLLFHQQVRKVLSFLVHQVYLLVP